MPYIAGEKIQGCRKMRKYLASVCGKRKAMKIYRRIIDKKQNISEIDISNVQSIYINNFPTVLRKYIKSYINNIMNNKYDQYSISLFNIDFHRYLLGIICISTRQNTHYDIRISDSHTIAVHPFASRKFIWKVPYFDCMLYVDIYWMPFDNSFERLNILANGNLMDIIYKGINYKAIEKSHFRFSINKDLSIKQKLFHTICKLPFYRKKFNHCWIFIDRDFKADDNAEHLYRWIMNTYPTKHNIFFALRKDSSDWIRLKNEGFKLLDISRLSYGLAYVHADWIISSNITGYITKEKWKSIYADLMHCQFCFLQHGVTKDYQNTLNRANIDMIVASSNREYSAFAEDKIYPYIFSSKEVQLTGLARYDALYKKASCITNPKLILIMPTWRKKITGEMIKGTGQFKYNPNFKESFFFISWQKLLRSKILQHVAETCEYYIKFYPHPYVKQQLKDFTIPDYIDIINDLDGKLQNYLADTALLITDYSSIAFDIAWLYRAILYYQFDREKFFNGGHAYAKGYFDYNDDAFGDIAISCEEIEQLLVKYLEDGMEMHDIYKERAKKFFQFHDANNCERTYNALCALSKQAIMI
jgi:hypothetical protein